eukprot:scaffold30437_cov31-Tisochrysis_lutea.AAC.1
MGGDVCCASGGGGVTRLWLRLGRSVSPPHRRGGSWPVAEPAGRVACAEVPPAIATRSARRAR